MPTYQYKCEACNETSERILTISKRNQPCVDPCAKCGKEEVKMVIGTSPNSIVSTTNTQGGKVPEGFKDVLRTIQANSGRGNTIDV